MRGITRKTTVASAVGLVGVVFAVLMADGGGGGPDPGVVAVVGERSVPLHLSVDSGTQCKLNYPASRVTVWTSPLRTNSIPPDTPFTSGSGSVFGDANGDGYVKLDDLVFIRNDLGTSIAASDLDGNGIVEEHDLVLCRNALGAGPDSLVVYVEALAPSEALCDAGVELLTDPEGDGSYALSATRSVTSVSISISPAAGGLGTPLDIAIQPAIAPLAFDSATTAIWFGVYEPSVGPATDRFQVDYSRWEFRESSGSTASLFIGDGTVRNAPPVESLSGTGTLNGSVALVLSGHTIRRSFSFNFQASGVAWEKLTYPVDYLEWTFGPPSLDGEPAHVQIFDWSGHTNPLTEGMLLYSKEVHHAVVLRIPETPSAAAAAPEFLLVDLISMDASLTEVDRRPSVRLDPVPDDGDPAYLVYSTHLSKPVVLINVQVEQSAYPNVTVLQGIDNGYVLAAPSGY